MRREAPSLNSPDREVGVNIANKKIRGPKGRHGMNLIPVLRTSLIGSNTITTTLPSRLFHEGPSGPGTLNPPRDKHSEQQDQHRHYPRQDSMNNKSAASTPQI